MSVCVCSENRFILPANIYGQDRIEEQAKEGFPLATIHVHVFCVGGYF